MRQERATRRWRCVRDGQNVSLHSSSSLVHFDAHIQTDACARGYTQEDGGQSGKHDSHKCMRTYKHIQENMQKRVNAAFFL